MASDGGDGLIGNQGTVVQLQLQCNQRGIMNTELDTYPLEVPAAPGNGYERLVGYFGAIRYIQALQPWTMLGNGSQSMVGHGIQACNVQCQQTAAPVDDGYNPVVGQFSASGQGESLDPLATHERLHRPIAYLVTQI